MYNLILLSLVFSHLLLLETTSSMLTLHKQFQHHCIGNSLLIPEMYGFIHFSSTKIKLKINL